METKRLFYALDVVAPWPENFPMGKIIKEEFRHITLAFLGDVKENCLKPLYKIPLPNIQVGKVGVFDQLLFLPQKDPHVVAWHIHWFLSKELLIKYQDDLRQYLEIEFFKNLIFKKKDKKFLSHVTLARNPKELEIWKSTFFPIPCFFNTLHLYESFGNSNYVSLWQKKFLKPFEPIEHMADFAFKVRGESFEELCLNAEIALAFQFPMLTPFIFIPKPMRSLEEIIIALNEMVTLVDVKVGCPIKAVSFHGEALLKEEKIYEWEMVIDV